MIEFVKFQIVASFNDCCRISCSRQFRSPVAMATNWFDSFRLFLLFTDWLVELVKTSEATTTFRSAIRSCTIAFNSVVLIVLATKFKVGSNAAKGVEKLQWLARPGLYWISIINPLRKRPGSVWTETWTEQQYWYFEHLIFISRFYWSLAVCMCRCLWNVIL